MKLKDLLVLSAVPGGLFVLYWSFIGWQHFFVLFLSAIGFGILGCFLFRSLPHNVAGWLSLILAVSVFAYGVAGNSVWHKAMVMLIPGYLLGAQVGATWREGTRKIGRKGNTR